MEIVKTGERVIEFYLDTVFLAKYGLNVETFEKKEPFTALIVEDLLNLANEEYGLNFDEFDTPKEIYVINDCVLMVFEK